MKLFQAEKDQVMQMKSEDGNAEDMGILGEPFPVLYVRHQCPLDGM